MPLAGPAQRRDLWNVDNVGRSGRIVRPSVGAWQRWQMHGWFFAPLDWQPDRHTSLQPDLLVVRRESIGERNVAGRLELAVEVLSPSSRRKDLVLKHSKYADAGVASCWAVDPQEPSVTAWDLVDGAYHQVGAARGAEPVTLRRPYPVTVVPADLV